MIEPPSEMRGSPDAGQVDVDHVLPRLLGHFRGGAVGDDSRVRDDYVQPAERIHPGRDCCVQRHEISHVGFSGDDSPADCLDEARRLDKVLLPRQVVGDAVDIGRDIDGDDVSALLGEADRVAAPLPTCCAGNQGNLAFYTTHLRAPFILWRLAGSGPGSIPRP